MQATLHIQGLKTNDPKAYADMFDTYFRGLFVFACNMVFREDVAYDIVQEVFVSVYEKSSSLKEEASLKSYLYKSVRNRCYNYLRDRKVEDRRLMLYAEACLAADALEMIEEEELVRRVREFLKQLPDQCREVCRMRLFDNLSFEEIAALLDISESTVRVQLHRGIKKMHSFFDSHGIAMSAALTAILLI